MRTPVPGSRRAWWVSCQNRPKLGLPTASDPAPGQRWYGYQFTRYSPLLSQHL